MRMIMRELMLRTAGMGELQTSALRALQLMDFTTLADDDTHERVEKLCADAR